MASGMRLAAAAPLDSHSIFPLHSFWISTSIISPRIMSSAAAANGVKVHTLDTFRPILKQLALSLAPPSPGARPAGAAINAAQVRELLEHLADASFTSNQQHHAMLGSALTALRLTGLDASAEVLAMASEVFLARSIDVSVPDLDVADKEQYAGSLDLVGTGGDGQDTFNVSTTAAIVAAGVPGIKVCKVSRPPRVLRGWGSADPAPLPTARSTSVIFNVRLSRLAHQSIDPTTNTGAGSAQASSAQPALRLSLCLAVSSLARAAGADPSQLGLPDALQRPRPARQPGASKAVHLGRAQPRLGSYVCRGAAKARHRARLGRVRSRGAGRD